MKFLGIGTCTSSPSKLIQPALDRLLILNFERRSQDSETVKQWWILHSVARNECKLWMPLNYSLIRLPIPQQNPIKPVAINSNDCGERFLKVIPAKKYPKRRWGKPWDCGLVHFFGTKKRVCSAQYLTLQANFRQNPRMYEYLNNSLIGIQAFHSFGF